MASDFRQALVVRLEANVARAVRTFLAESARGYSGLDELLEVALLNQLNIEGFAFPISDRTGEPVGPSDNATGVDVPPLRRAARLGPREVSSSELGTASDSTMAPVVPLVDSPPPTQDTLFVMTNRLSPLKIAARALATAAIELGEWPSLADFHDRASRLAREVGTRLRKEGSRRWVAYPVGADEAKAKERFVNSFTITAPAGRPRGALAVLGLAGLARSEAGSSDSNRKKQRSRQPLRVGLTEEGWKLSMLPSAILGETEGNTLSMDEAALLRNQLLRAPGERAVIREFLGLVRRSAGSQSRLNELMAVRDPTKSADLLVAERAALVGRLGELDLISHEGRGADGRIRLTSVGRETLRRLHIEERERE